MELESEFPVTGKIVTQGYFKTFSTGCLSNKTANILFWLLQFIYYTQVPTESISVTKHQTKIWESSEEEKEWVRENTRCAFASFAIQLSKASFSLGTNWEQLPMLKQGQLCPSLPPTWTTKALPHSWPSALEDSLVGWRTDRGVGKQMLMLRWQGGGKIRACLTL